MWKSIQSYIDPYLRELPSLMPYILVVIGILVALILARLFIILWSKKQVSAPEDGDEEDSGGTPAGAITEAGRAGLSELSSIFSAAMRRLRRLMRRRGYHFDWFVWLTGHRYRYDLPWFAVIGEEGSGKTTILQQLELHTPVEPVITENGEEAGGCNWWFFNDGLVLDVSGRFVLRPDGQTVDQGWTTILNELRKRRSRQPLNGLVLTIPCTDLVGDAALDSARLEDKASRLRNKLVEAQQTLGMRLPVYVLVTKCDAVPGFQSFCAEMDTERRQDMLGWSNAYALDAAYTSDWIDEAFASVREDLHYAQVRELEDSIQADDSDAFFLFPDQFDTLREKLKTYLDPIFRESAYHEAHFLRGVYFSGDASRSEAAGTAEAPSEEVAPAFTDDLLRSKVFKEWKIARPLSSAVSWQQKLTRGVQATTALLVLLGVFGLWYAGDTLQEKRQSILPMLQTAQSSIERVEEWQGQTNGPDEDGNGGGNAGQTGDLPFNQMASSLLQRMVRASQMDLTSFLVPASWFSDTEWDIDEAVASTYDKVIFRAMHHGLELRARQLTQAGLGSGASQAARAESLSVAALPAYQAWNSYTQRLATLERHAHQYNRLPDTQNLDHFAGLAEYLFEVNMSNQLMDNADVYRRTLQNADPPPFQGEPYRGPATERMRQYARRLHQSLPQEYGLLQELQHVADRFNQLNAGATRLSGSGGSEARALRRLNETLRTVERTLQGESARWLTNDSLALRRVYGSFLAYADTSDLVAASVAPEIRQNGRTAIDRLQGNLQAVESGMTGPLLQRQNGQFQLAWSQDVRLLRNALDRLLNQPFMQAGDQTGVFRTSIPQGRRLVWRTEVLKQMTQHIQQYDSVVTRGFTRFPPGVRASVRAVASSGLRQHLMDHLIAAQSFELETKASTPYQRETALRARVDRFRAALPSLQKILAVQSELDLDVEQGQVVHVTAAQAHALLQEADRLLQEEGLYTVSTSAFQQWKGRRSPNLAVLHARDSQGVDGYLRTQRQRLQFLATDVAQAPLSFLSNWKSQVDPSYWSLIDRWNAILSQVRRYENQTAGNTISVYEGFVRNTMSDVSPTRYFMETPSEVVNATATDFFLQKRNALRRRLYERSRELALRNARSSYQALSEQFSTALAGRFPFARLEPDTTVPDAPIRGVREFYAQFDRFAEQSLPVLQRVGLRSEVQQFVRQVRGVRPFFAAHLDQPSTYPVPTVDVQPTFRVHRDHEAKANQILNWRLTVGGQHAQYGETDSLNWAAGDPVTVRLQWAKDAPGRPKVAQRGLVAADGRVVRFRYDGQWALLRLLRQHEPPPSDFDRRVDPNPYTLRFAIAVANQQAESVTNARVYLRLQLYQPDSVNKIVLDAPFPKRAPALGETTAP